MYMCFGVWEKALEVCLLFQGLPHLVLLLLPSSLMMKCSALNYRLLEVFFVVCTSHTVLSHWCNVVRWSSPSPLIYNVDMTSFRC